MKYISSKLNKIGMTNIWNEQMIQGKDFSKDTKLIASIKTRLKDISSQTMISTLTTNQGKLTFLSLSKNNHNFESYLNINNFEHRRAIAKIRTSSHKLEVETGRWRGVSRDQRICKNCTLNKVEDENHFLFECGMHVTGRKELYNMIKAKINVDISHIPSHPEKIQEIFYSEDLAILNALGKFIKNALEKRETTTCHVLPPHYVYYSTKT